jgi:hypothetical protein
METFLLFLVVVLWLDAFVCASLWLGFGREA